jgi:hypothetical protein
MRMLEAGVSNECWSGTLWCMQPHLDRAMDLAAFSGGDDDCVQMAALLKATWSTL